MEDWNQSIQILMRRFNDSIYFLTIFSNLLKKSLQVLLQPMKTSLFVLNTTVEVLYWCKLIRWTDVADVKEVLVLNTYGAWWTKWWFEIFTAEKVLSGLSTTWRNFFSKFKISMLFPPTTSNANGWKLHRKTWVFRCLEGHF